jgi:predicted anti-sigma-YlaC factor YlaD
VNCSACKSRIGLLQDGELSPRDARLVGAHVQSCAECRIFADRLTAVESSLIRLEHIEPRADFTLAVMASIAAMPVPARQTARLWWLVIADVALWIAIGALTAFGAIRWKVIAAGAGAFAAKAGIALGTFYDVAQHFHINDVLALGVGIEIVFLVVFFFAARKYLPRVRATLSGVLS